MIRPLTIEYELRILLIMKTKELSKGIWNVTKGQKNWTGRAKDAAEAKEKAQEMWLGR